MPYGLAPGRGDIPVFIPAEPVLNLATPGWPGGMQGRVETREEMQYILYMYS